MKKRARIGEKEKRQLQLAKKRQKWMWEFIRRNKDYIKDYERTIEDHRHDLSSKFIEGDSDKLLSKWNFSGYLPDPDDPDLPDFAGPDPNPPILGSPYVKEGQVVIPAENMTQVVRSWPDQQIRLLSFTKGRKLERLTKKNCPKQITIVVKIDPLIPFEKEYLKNQVIQRFQTHLDMLLEAQKRVFKRKSATSHHWDVYEKYLEVYDLKKNNDKKISWPEIALKVFPQEVSKTTAHRRKPKYDMLPLPTAVDKVRYYWKEANRMINKGGWREI
jgi:hypothetical protein